MTKVGFYKFQTQDAVLPSKSGQSRWYVCPQPHSFALSRLHFVALEPCSVGECSLNFIFARQQQYSIIAMRCTILYDSYTIMVLLAIHSYYVRSSLISVMMRPYIRRELCDDALRFEIICLVMIHLSIHSQFMLVLIT